MQTLGPCPGISNSMCLRFVLLTVGFAVVTNAQVDKPFPTDDEINLLLTQVDRAVQQYKLVIDQEEIQMGKSYADAVARDRKVVNALEVALKAFKLDSWGGASAAAMLFGRLRSATSEMSPTSGRIRCCLR
jgi:hypothetical protein